MGTSNFSRPKFAEHTYAICMPYDDIDEETGEEVTHYYEHWEVEETLEWLKESIEEKFNTQEPYKEWSGDDRNLITIYDDSNVNGIDIEFRFNLSVESGYYEGGKVDWDVELYVNGIEAYVYDDLTIDIDNVQYDLELKGIKSLQSRLESKLRRINREVNKVISKITMPLKVKARFSNGETWYSKV